jgi:hypothetical protein
MHSGIDSVPSIILGQLQSCLSVAFLPHSSCLHASARIPIRGRAASGVNRRRAQRRNGGEFMQADRRPMRPDYHLVLPWHFEKEFLERERGVQGLLFGEVLPTR